jgi:hypothetical protein
VSLAGNVLHLHGFGWIGDDGLSSSGGEMSEVVVFIGADEGRDPSRLMQALDAFAKWAAESGLSTESGDAPDIMMKSEYSGGEMRRKLVFQDRQHAARFLSFWRVERHREHADDRLVARI